MNEAEMRAWAWEQAMKWAPMEKPNNMKEHERTANAILRWLQTGDLEQSDEHNSKA